MKARFARYRYAPPSRPAPSRLYRSARREESPLAFILTATLAAILAPFATLAFALALAAPSMSPATLAAWQALLARVFG